MNNEVIDENESKDAQSITGVIDGEPNEETSIIEAIIEEVEAVDGSMLKNIVEGALLAAGSALTIENIGDLFLEGGQPAKEDIQAAIDELIVDCEGRGVEVKLVASGYRMQVKQSVSTWVGRLWEEKPARYTRALLETLSLIAYRQPITRGEIEEIRGVSVSTNIVKTLLEREWVRVVGHRDVPGRPAMYATTKQFLDYFDLAHLNELPSLAEIRDLEKINPELDLQEQGAVDAKTGANSDDADGGSDVSAEGQRELGPDQSETDGNDKDTQQTATVTSINGDSIDREELDDIDLKVRVEDQKVADDVNSRIEAILAGGGEQENLDAELFSLEAESDESDSESSESAADQSLDHGDDEQQTSVVQAVEVEDAESERLESLEEEVGEADLIDDENDQNAETDKIT